MHAAPRRGAPPAWAAWTSPRIGSQAKAPQVARTRTKADESREEGRSPRATGATVIGGAGIPPHHRRIRRPNVAMARPTSVRTAARGKGSGPSAASTAWNERVRLSPRTSGAPGSSSVQANTPAAARAASGRTSGRIKRRQTWRRLAPACRAASSQAGPICPSAWADAMATSGTPLASPSQIQPIQPPQSLGEIHPATATLGQSSGGPSSPLSPTPRTPGGTPPARGPTRRAVPVPRIASADDPGQADPHRQRPQGHHARDRDAVPEAVPDERVPDHQGHRKRRDPDDARRPAIEHRRRDQPRCRDERDEPDSRRHPASQPSDRIHARDFPLRYGDGRSDRAPSTTGRSADSTTAGFRAASRPRPSRRTSIRRANSRLDCA